MNKRKIEITEYTDVITSALKKGVFLTSKVGDKVNTMVIGWGHVGRIWERPVFIAYIRDIRYTVPRHFEVAAYCKNTAN